MTIVGKQKTTNPNPQPGEPLPLGSNPVAAPTGIKLPGREETRDETVPDNHPIAASFPEELVVTVRLRRTSLEVREEFTRETRHNPATGKRERGPLTRRRMLTATYETQPEDMRHSRAEVVGQAEIRGVEFGPDGVPTDGEEWNAIVREIVENAIEEATNEIEELIGEAVDAREEGTAE